MVAIQDVNHEKYMSYFTNLQEQIKKITQKSLVRNTLWMFLGKVISIFMQATYFILIARHLGSENFGMFMGVTALASIAVPFGTLGSTDILIRNVSRNKILFKKYLGDALVTTFFCSFFVICLSFLIGKFILPKFIPNVLILSILISDILGLSIWNICCGAFLGLNQHKNTAKLQIFYNFVKVLSAIALVIFFDDPNAINWSILYVFGTTITAIFSFFFVCFSLGFPELELSHINHNIFQGIYFSLDRSAANINSSIDRTMLSSLSTLSITGIYSAAYRLIEVGYIPILVVFSSTYTKFFEEGALGISNAFKFAKRLIPLISIYGIFVFIGCIFFAPFIPYILGESYIDSVPVLYWLAPMPLIIGMQLVAADTLTGSGYQKLRGLVQISAALINISLNYFLIPIFSWRGAAWATLTTDSLILLCYWGAIWRLNYQNLKNSS
ncbi:MULTISPECIES: flippase [Limnospira]|nr:flippase [Arthrospira platensis]MDF2210605.1 flippase [Arthrospira platensis NCB002]MDT9183131.1 flippase [Limnospira sp. PMC 289.06]QQW31945.2 flippase [Arthrospira sp. PCC 9108]